MSRHFNKLSPAHAERLAMLSEEAGEIVQAVGKILRHGYENWHPDGTGPTNREALVREIKDIRAVMEHMSSRGDVDYSSSVNQIEELISKKLQYTHHQGPVPDEPQIDRISDEPKTYRDHPAKSGFKPGDVVQLKSGGHPMTVDTGHCGRVIQVIYFNGSEIVSDELDPDLLQPYQEEAPF